MCGIASEVQICVRRARQATHNSRIKKYYYTATIQYT